MHLRRRRPDTYRARGPKRGRTREKIRARASVIGTQKAPALLPGPLHKNLRTYKPDPVSTLRRTSAIYLGPCSRTASIDLPAGSRGPRLACLAASVPAYLVFQPVGFTKLPRSHGTLVGSYPTFSSLPPPCGGSAVSLSVALSIAPPSPAALLPVRKHGALCCPDFPPSPPCGGKNGGAVRRM